jgi:hypothetical protein
VSAGQDPGSRFGVCGHGRLGVTLNSSLPITGGWEGDENNATGTTVNITAYVLCAT